MKHEEIMELSSTATKLVNKYNTAVDKATKSAWEIAKIVYDTVNRPDFKDLFPNGLTGYSKAINLSLSKVSRLVDIFERKLYIESVNGLVEFSNEKSLPNDFSVGQMQEVISIEKDDTEDFLTTSNISGKNTVKEIREAVKAYKASKTEPEAEEGDEVETSAEELSSEVVDTIMTVTYNGDIYNVIDADIINKILELCKGGDN